MKRLQVGYAKLGRSMPLDLANCGSLGGDIEMVPTLKLLAERHPDVDFVLVGRNSGEWPSRVGLPGHNVHNPWIVWQPRVRELLNWYGLNYPSMSIPDQTRVAELLHEVTGEAFRKLDGMIMWLGQHGTSNQPLPKIEDRTKLTKPYDWATLYGSYLLNGINAWRDVDMWNREEVLLNADVRNYVKYRDSKWPWRHPVLGQYDQVNVTKHERYGDATGFDEWARFGTADLSGSAGHQELWQSKVATVYSRLEISALVPGTPFGDTVKFNDDWNRPHNFGMVVNETRREVNPARARRTVLRDWVLPLVCENRVGFLHGKWSARSLAELDLDIQPVPQLDYISKLQTARCTFTTPASGSGWATAKPWEAFAAGVVCFFHPAYDDQDHILGDADPELRAFLRVSTPEELSSRIDLASTSEATWRYMVNLQRQHFGDAVAELRFLKLIEERLEL